MIKVEKALFRDSGELVNLELKSAEFPLSVDLIKIFFTVEQRCAFVAKIGNKIVGSCLVSYDKEAESCYIASLVVHPDFRRKGVSRKLLDSMSNYASSYGLKKFQLRVAHYLVEDTEDPWNLKEWLHKVGFRFTGIQHRAMFRYGYYYDELTFERLI